jgi:hypothetical protein
MAKQSDVIAAVLREYESYKSSRYPFCYNTGYGGRGTKSTETASMSDFEAAGKSLKDKVAYDHGTPWSVRIAASFSGSGTNEWSILIEVAGKPQPVFNFHMSIA